MRSIVNKALPSEGSAYFKHGLPKLSLLALASLLTAACSSPENIFTPASGTHFNANSGIVSIQGLLQSTAACYTIDGSEPVWNNGTCVGGSTVRLQGPVTFAQIPLNCSNESGENVQRTVKVIYDWAGAAGHSATASYLLDCNGDAGGGDSGGGDSGGGDSGGGDSGGGDSGGGDSGGGVSGIVTLTPVADSYVKSTSADTNYGTEDQLFVDLDPKIKRSFLRFSVPALAEGVQSATLRLYGTDESPDGPKVYRTSNSWEEGDITWNNQPSTSGSAIADTDDLSIGWVDIDVTDAITGSGDISFALIADSTNGFDFDSREGQNSPELVIVTESGSSGGGASGGDSAARTNVMSVGQVLNSDEYMVSPNGEYRFYLQGDGNLVLRDWQTRDSLWSSGTHGDNGTRLTLQNDGNLVLYTDLNSVVWTSNTVGSGAQKLMLGDDGTLGLYQNGASVWSVGGSGSGSGSGIVNTGPITHVDSTEVRDSNGRNVKIERPAGTQPGDLLVLVLHRTDDVLPMKLDGWESVAQCYKENNPYQCVTYDDCQDWYNGDEDVFCKTFDDGGDGEDLAQTIFYKKVGPNEPASYTFDLNRNPDDSGKASWVILTALRGANTSDPIRGWAHEGCDGNKRSVFPSVFGHEGDMVLLSHSNDDEVAQDKFRAPTGMTTFSYIVGSDDTGFLYGGTLQETGQTGEMKTNGDGVGEGKDGCKDALITLIIKPE